VTRGWYTGLNIKAIGTVGIDSEWKSEHPDQRGVIDQIVYKLYGLTEDEIAIVEGQD
jgi:hypothetical protein